MLPRPLNTTHWCHQAQRDIEAKKAELVQARIKRLQNEEYEVGFLLPSCQLQAHTLSSFTQN